MYLSSNFRHIVKRIANITRFYPILLPHSQGVVEAKINLRYNATHTILSAHTCISVSLELFIVFTD